MAHHVVTFKGFDGLSKGMKKRLNMDAVKRVVKMNTAYLQCTAQDNVPVDTGHLRDSIEIELKDNGMTGIVEPTAEYAAYVEFGTRKMTANPYLKPAWEAEKKQFKKDMKYLTR